MKILTGEVSGSTTRKQLPDIEFELCQIKAVASNSGKVYVGNSGVTKPDGTTDTSSGMELAAGDFTWFIMPGNLSDVWIICDNAGDDIVYIINQ